MMRRCIRKLLLAVWALTLCPTARGAEIRFRPGIPAADAARWESLARAAWSSWEDRFGIRVERPDLEVSLADAADMPSDFGRARGGRIQLNTLLTRGAADTVVGHELAHVFLESRCPGIADQAPLVSEAFALFVSEDAARRVFEGTPFLYAAAARDWLLVHDAESRARTRSVVQALARVLAQPEMRPVWEKYFTDTLGSCREASFAAAGAIASFLDAVRGVGSSAAVSSVDFLLIDGLSGETLAQDGQPGARFPVGSILKPSLVAAVPGLMESRLARDAPEWHCPGKPKKGEIFTWERALAASCNGFFLDFAAAEAGDWSAWEEEMRRIGVSLPEPPMSMEERIGLRGKIVLSPLHAVRLFAWLDRKAPFVVDALTQTAREGTLASAPESEWFVRRHIALKTGTVRDVLGNPLHAWIVAVGARDASGAPAFVAAMHASGRATVVLLPELKRRLEAALTGLERGAEVQILGLVPEARIGLACDRGAPLLARRGAGPWRLEKPGTSVAAGALEPGDSFACPAAALAVTFEDGHGTTKQRRYFGELSIDAASGGELPSSSVPLRERSARARRGSRFVLTTSERSYAVSSILSELPSGHSELLAALSLIVRHNRLTHRHGERAPCDTTHCNLFGQDESASPAGKNRAERAVALAAAFEIAVPDGQRRWLPFFLGGTRQWRQRRSAESVGQALGLDGEAVRLTLSDDGMLAAGASAPKRFPCEVVRNQLRLPSCPDDVRSAGGEFLFRGHGEGHGAGLDLTLASAAASEGADFRKLLGAAWPDLQIVRRTDPGGSAP